MTRPSSRGTAGFRPWQREFLPFATAAAALVTAYALVMFFQAGMWRSDFAVFYLSGEAWLRGGTMYNPAAPNLNPPLVTVGLFAPLAALGYPAAPIVWVALSGAALIASLRRIAATLELAGAEIIWIAALLLITHAAATVWFYGQITWLLLYPVTQGWAAYRAGRHGAAGVWLAPAIACKPILALLPLLLTWRVWLPAGIGSAALTTMGIAWTGWPAWRAWLRTSEGIVWLPWPTNASLWGMTARLQHDRMDGLRLSDLRPELVLLVLIVVAILLSQLRRIRDPDRRFSLAFLWTMLVSPLGWIYYLPIGVGPLAASWPRSWLTSAAFAAMLVPFHLLQRWFVPTLAVQTYGQVFSLGLLCAWVAWARSPAAVPPFRDLRRCRTDR